MPPESNSKPAKRGCLFYGCLSLVALVIIFLVAGYFTIRYTVNTAINNYTDDAPQTFETVVMEEEERNQLRRRIDTFNKAKGKTNQPVELILTGREINVLIADAPDRAEIKDKVRINIEGENIIARATIPLEPFSSMPFMSRLKDRHLNISFRVGVELEDGKADVSIVSADVNGTPVPQEILDAIENEESFQAALSDPQILKHLDQIDSVKVEDSELRVTTGGVD